MLQYSANHPATPPEYLRRPIDWMPDSEQKSRPSRQDAGPCRNNTLPVDSDMDDDSLCVIRGED